MYLIVHYILLKNCT